jgi:hypothetical protein
MMRYSSYLAIGAVALAAALPGTAVAQRSDSYTWKIGFEAGAMAYETRVQDTKVVPAVGAQLLIMAHRGGLLVGVDEGIGSNENATSSIQFNDVRRFQAVLMAFPLSGPIEPYFGGGGGLLTVVGPRVNPALMLDPATAQEVQAAAEANSTSGFLTILFGVQGRMGRTTIFAQYQAGTSPSDDNLLHGSTQTAMAGVRIGLGSTKETAETVGN